MFITSKNKYLLNDMSIIGTCSIPLINWCTKPVVTSFSFCFVQFSVMEEAEKALQDLRGCQFHDKRLILQVAYNSGSMMGKNDTADKMKQLPESMTQKGPVGTQRVLTNLDYDRYSDEEDMPGLEGPFTDVRSSDSGDDMMPHLDDMPPALEPWNSSQPELSYGTPLVPDLEPLKVLVPPYDSLSSELHTIDDDMPSLEGPMPALEEPMLALEEQIPALEGPHEDFYNDSGHGYRIMQQEGPSRGEHRGQGYSQAGYIGGQNNQGVYDDQGGYKSQRGHSSQGRHKARHNSQSSLKSQGSQNSQGYDDQEAYNDQRGYKSQRSHSNQSGYNEQRGHNKGCINSQGGYNDQDGHNSQTGKIDQEGHSVNQLSGHMASMTMRGAGDPSDMSHQDLDDVVRVGSQASGMSQRGRGRQRGTGRGVHQQRVIGHSSHAFSHTTTNQGQIYCTLRNFLFTFN